MKATFYLFGYLQSPRVGKGILAPLTFYYCGSHSTWLTPFSGPIEFPIQRKWKCFIFNKAAHNESLSYYTESCNFLPLFPAYYCGAEISKHIFYDLFIGLTLEMTVRRMPPLCYLCYSWGLSVCTYLSHKRMVQLFIDVPVCFLQKDQF